MGRELKHDWWVFHKANPQVYGLFKRFTRDAINAGFEHYSSDAICHRIRWHTGVETKGGDDFRINNNWAAYYARLFMCDFPEHDGFFRTRTTTASTTETGETGAKETKDRAA